MASGEGVMTKISNINCAYYKDGRCLHDRAPRRLFSRGLPKCIHFPQLPARTRECSLQERHPKPSISEVNHQQHHRGVKVEAIILGAPYVDKITKFEGVATGRCVYLSGCTQVLLSPTIDKDGKLRDGVWFDEQRLERQDGPVVALDNSQTPGCDIPAPKY